MYVNNRGEDDISVENSAEGAALGELVIFFGTFLYIFQEALTNDVNV